MLNRLDVCIVCNAVFGLDARVAKALVSLHRCDFDVRVNTRPNRVCRGFTIFPRLEDARVNPKAGRCSCMQCLSSFSRDLKAAWSWRAPGRLLDVVREPCGAAWLQTSADRVSEEYLPFAARLWCQVGTRAPVIDR